MSVGERGLCVTTYDSVCACDEQTCAMPHVQAYKPTGGTAVCVYVHIHGLVCNSLWISCAVCGCVYT